MDPYPSCMPTSALSSMSKKAGSVSAIHAAAVSINNEKATAGRDVTANKASGWATSIVTKRSTQPCLPSFFKSWWRVILVWRSLHTLYAKLLSQFAKLNAIVPQKQRIVHENVVKLKKDLVFNLNKWTVLTWLSTIPVHRWTYLNTTAFVYLIRWTLDWIALPARLWTTR